MESAPDLLYVQKELYRMFATSDEKKDCSTAGNSISSETRFLDVGIHDGFISIGKKKQKMLNCHG